MFFVAAVLVSFALLNVAESACAGSKSAELINVGFASSSAVFIDTNVPPGTVVRVQATEDDDDSTIYVEASGHDDITVTLKDGNAPGQVSLVVASAKSSAQPLASTTTLANAFGTGTITFDNGNGSNNNPTAGTTASLVDSQTSSGSTLRALAPLVSVLSAAMSCFGVAKADEVCPLTVVVKYSFKSAPNVRFVNLNDKSALVCALGSVSKLPASTITGVTLKANPFTWAPTDGYCLPTSFFQKNDDVWHLHDCRRRRDRCGGRAHVARQDLCQWQTVIGVGLEMQGCDVRHGVHCRWRRWRHHRVHVDHQ